MQADVLDVEHGQLVRLEHVHHLAQGRRVGARENALVDPGVHQRRLIAADAVHEAAAFRRQRAAHQRAEILVVALADVLEHADRDERVVRARQIAVVVLDELDLAVEAELLGPRARVRDLLLRDVEAAHAHAVVLRHEQREAAPAAAGLDDALAGLQLQLAADVMHLRLLRLLDRHRGIREVRAGVLQRLAVEPQLVEVVAEVVVVVNVALRVRQVGRELAGRARAPGRWPVFSDV